MSGFFKSSIGRKYAMAFSAMALLIFLLFHLTANFLSVISKDAFNIASDFMGYNPLVQFIFQPVLGFLVIFHFVLGFVLEAKNHNARPVKYAVSGASANSTWMSRNMIISGAVILAFLALHLYDFWWHEINFKYVEAFNQDSSRYWPELHEKFASPVRVVLYVIAFVLLGLHLAHGFQSSFQSVGARHPKYTPVIKTIGSWFAVLVPLGFAFIAVFHFVTQ